MYKNMHITLVSSEEGLSSFSALENRIVRLAQEGLLTPRIEVAAGLRSLIVKLLDRRMLWTGCDSRAIDFGVAGVGMVSARFTLGGEAC